MDKEVEKISKTSTVLVCNACQNTSFEVKGDEKTLLLACKSCGTTVKVKDGGIAEAPRFELQSPELATFAHEKPLPNLKGNSEKGPWYAVNFRVPAAVRSIIRAALLVAKASQGIDGRSYAGTAMGYICADFLSGVDVTAFSQDVQGKVYQALSEAIAASEDDSIELDEGIKDHVMANVSVVDSVKGYREYADNTGVEVRKGEPETGDLFPDDSAQDEPNEESNEEDSTEEEAPTKPKKTAKKKAKAK